MGQKVLVVDDSPFIYKAVKRALEPQGFEVIGHALNGQQGMEMYAELKPDLITLDVTMPVMDGIETARRLCAVGAKTPVVMLTAMGDDELMETARKYGVKRFVSKPFTAEQLLSTVTEVLAG
jgi:two-component system chemotaxis response regulator CheY